MLVKSFRSIALIASLSVLASAALAQSGKIMPTRVFMTAPGVKENTSKYNPQINPIFRPTLFRPENPGRNLVLPPPNGGSAVQVGGKMPFTNGAPGPKFPGIGATGWVPADPHFAVSKTHIVQVVNTDIAFFNKTGTKLFQSGMDGAGGFFSTIVPGTDFIFDPKAFFDPNSNRFFVVALDQTGDESSLLVAVSDDDNPVGNWFKYKINCKLTVGSNTFWLDYPGWGCNKDALVCTGNMFGLNNGGFGGAQFLVIKKAPLLTGAAAQVTSLVDAAGGSVQVAETRDNAIDRVYAMSLASTGSVRVYSVNNPGGAPTLSFTTVSVPSFNQVTRSANTIGNTLDPVSDRLFQVHYFNGRLYTAHVAMTNDNRIGSRWYQIKTNNYPSSAPTTEMAGMVTANAGQDAFMPGISVNKNGDVAMIFTRSSSSVAADVMVCSRRATDPAGTMSTPQLMASSTGSGYGGRWGDYHSVQVDPSDSLTFWGNTMTIAGGNWATQIVSWKLSTPIEVADQYDAQSVSTFEGTFQSGDVTSVRTANNSTYDVKSTFIQSLGHVAGVQANFVVPVGSYEGLFIKVKANQSITSTGMVWLWNWNTGAWEHIKSWPLPNSQTISVQATGNLARFIGPAGDVRVVVRTVIGPSKPKQHVLKADLIQILASPSGS